jgi:hypothetical protein
MTDTKKVIDNVRILAKVDPKDLLAGDVAYVVGNTYLKSDSFNWFDIVTCVIELGQSQERRVFRQISSNPSEYDVTVDGKLYDSDIETGDGLSLYGVVKKTYGDTSKPVISSTGTPELSMSTHLTSVGRIRPGDFYIDGDDDVTHIESIEYDESNHCFFLNFWDYYGGGDNSLRIDEGEPVTVVRIKQLPC